MTWCNQNICKMRICFPLLQCCVSDALRNRYQMWQHSCSSGIVGRHPPDGQSNESDSVKHHLCYGHGHGRRCRIMSEHALFTFENTITISRRLLYQCTTYAPLVFYSVWPFDWTAALAYTRIVIILILWRIGEIWKTDSNSPGRIHWKQVCLQKKNLTSGPLLSYHLLCGYSNCFEICWYHENR